jgi:penicillin-insensitive murein DD-endopeptidase
MVKKLITSAIVLLVLILSAPHIFYKNKGESLSIGEYGKGALKNAYLLPRTGANFAYGSYFSYYLLGRAYIHSKVYQTIIDTYAEMHTIYPDRKFYVMECSRREGGRMFPHRTHQNGLSVDFFTPLIKNGHGKYFRSYGILRYALNFNANGTMRLNKKVSIDFNTMAKHILVMDEKARHNGLRIKKVIFNRLYIS